MTATPQLVQERLQERFGDDVQIDFMDEKGDGRHFYLYIVSGHFEGKSRIARSKLVYELLDDLIGQDSIHALRLKLKTPTEVQ